MTLPFDPARRREERDDLERLLEAALPAAISPDVPGHVDAERLAAWADQALDPAEQLQIDAHLAACEACQELAAALARTLSDYEAAGAGIETTPATLRRWTPVRIAKWVAPLAAAAAVMVWIGRPDLNLSEPDAVRRATEGQQTAFLNQPAQAPAQAATDDASRARQARSETAPPPGEKAQRDQELRSLRQAAPRSAAASPPAPAPAPVAPGAAPVAAPADLRPSAPAPAPLPGQASDTLVNSRLRGLAEPVEPASNQTLEVVTRQVDETLAAERFDGSARAGRGGGRGAQGQATAARDVATADPRWRVVAGRRIERSLDAGRTWSPLAVDTPSTIVAGTSPAASVCWLVGERGLVLVSTDGERFSRAPAPADVTLSGVVATTGRDAIVTATDGRRFATSDAGQTWRPLQEFPAPSF